MLERASDPVHFHSFFFVFSSIVSDRVDIREINRMTKDAEFKEIMCFIWEFGDIYSRLLRSFTARGFTYRDPTKGIRLISSRVTKLSQRYNKNTIDKW